ncbi:hypothetical protein LEP1GSC132_4138 [Leptospira kirschneri str. 200803703]|uniref:Uncharacterized protein n=2 Tax=Leptospira kirschneri TaxID=29507 RepID=A0A828XV92_9LEPT|nr:hypothetical protein LEP1GSC131_2070 [Leptospira kirschneri str. 200802841]EMN03357.1 hypothetical protein LEP1GSC046_3215 [Leptospira kirschneri serovar Bim str. 1051]EMO68411.1 hypothetical protein LEP1GSC132_4138 [Leptospira kirschneri str. 200803703]KPZ76152.1 hypothetical protein APS47_17575 [Leptospira kirschneri serovar Mozdok]OOV47163.1 hypothetical protein B1J94_16960 [Leptospira kirschneri serovar Grippotyphosa]
MTVSVETPKFYNKLNVNSHILNCYKFLFYDLCVRLKRAKRSSFVFCRIIGTTIIREEGPSRIEKGQRKFSFNERR